MTQPRTCVALACTATLMTLALYSGGCLSQHTSATQGPQGLADVAGLRAYFKSLDPGYPLGKIEADLSLPEPVETTAPAFEWPFWKYLYKKDRCYIRVWVDGSGLGKKDMVFQGEWYVYTEQEYEQARVPTP